MMGNKLNSMGDSGYCAPAGNAQTELTVNKSRFIGLLFPVETVDEAKQQVQRARKAFPGASHYVYAFRVGFGSSVIEGMSDDGEPAGTAGPPVLAVVRGSKVGDMLVVIIRYFGGIKLGIGGLVKAYTETAQQVVAEIKTIEKRDYSLLRLHLPYSLYQLLTLALPSFEAEIADQQFTHDVSLQIRLPASQVARFVHHCREISNGRVIPAPIQ